MKKYLFLVSTSIFLWSCSEDVDKTINTDLAQEADQFFRFSESFSESSYLGNISYVDYFRIMPEELPGCPTIVKSPDSRIIELDYDSPVECGQENKTPRTGKIILDFTLSNTVTPRWSLTYDNYTFEGVKIEGSRHFEGLPFNENRESFEMHIVEFEKNLSFVFDGMLSYSVSRSSLRPFALSTRGRIEGKNPAGRDFSIVITEAKEQLFQCYRQGWVLPQTGKESWIVSRGGSSGLDYEVTFQSSQECNPTVISTLPDGRTLQLNP